MTFPFLAAALAIGALLLVAREARRRRSRIQMLRSLIGERLRVSWAPGVGAYFTTEIQIVGRLDRIDEQTRRLHFSDLEIEEISGPDPRLLAGVITNGIPLDALRSCELVGHPENRRRW